MRLNTVTIQTAKMDETIAFYQKNMGLSVLVDHREGPVILVYLGESMEDACIEVLYAPDNCYQGRGISLAFAVDDLAKKMEALAANGVQTTGVISPTPDVRFCFAKDPNGLDVQFIQHIR